MTKCEFVHIFSSASNVLDTSETFLQDDLHPTTGVVFYVLGDKFHNFSDHNVVLNYTEALLHLNIIAQIAKYIVVGQGVSFAQLLELQNKLRLLAGARSIPFKHRINEKVHSKLVDKLHDKNVLITHPIQTGPLQFSSHLVIDDDCAEMTDGVEDEHLQGALLIEAAKQLFLACVRTYEPVPEYSVKQEQMSFTLNKLQVHFENFVFPLAAQLHLTLHDINIDGLCAKGAASVKIMQLGRPCCEITFYAHAYTKKISTSLEKRCGIKVKNRLIASEGGLLEAY